MAKQRGGLVPVDRTHRRNVGPLKESGHTLKRPRKSAMRMPKEGKTGSSR